jgi:hypothetical protein
MSMKLKVLGYCGAAAVAALLGAAPSAQTLADVARTEESRRKAIKEPAKVYTNQDLKRGPGDDQAVTSQPASAVPASTAGAPDQAVDAATGSEQKANEPVRDQAYWKGRIALARDQLDRTRILLAALESRVNALNADFINRDDPVQRAVIERDRQRAQAEMARIQKEIAQLTKAIADIEEEARRAGVPPSWLR